MHAHPQQWSPNRLSVIYDERCELCKRCCQWLREQPTFVDLRLFPSNDPEIYDLYGEFPWFRNELVVVADGGAAWVGPSAFIMCLWATINYRPMSYRLQGSTLAPLAETFFHALSSNRSLVSGLLGTHRCDDDTCSRSHANNPARS